MLEPHDSGLRTQFEQIHLRIHGSLPYPQMDFRETVFPARFGDYYLYEEKQECIDQIGSYPVKSYHGKNIHSQKTVQLRRFPLKQDDSQYSLLTELSSHIQMVPDFNNSTILQVVDFDSFDNHCFYVARACPQGTGLLEYLKRSPSLAWRLDSFLQIAKSCQDIHEELVIHGSIRAENIFISDLGKAHLWFWDEEWTLLLNSHLSRISSTPITTMKAARRHLACQSPEYTKVADIGVASDVYQLGLLLYEMLTEDISGTRRSGSKPSFFQLEPRKRILEQSDKGSRIPQKFRNKLQSICDTALAPHAKDRYKSVATLIHDYQQILQGHHEPRYNTPRS
ncbi:MAG: protein kinase [Planctomycetota bacterium]|nr:protein kinase [Planctomycetota bacterium]